eukprot:CCRYP_001290-RA/>CCRYP_001290-RA protein AED:0.03 eAED:0.03 QI:67/1/1/1/0/0/3/25/738
MAMTKPSDSKPVLPRCHLITSIDRFADARGGKPKIILLFLIICLYRLANAWVIRTQFDPDEYWQTLEPAYCMVFGSSYQNDGRLIESDNANSLAYGCALTWEWTRRWMPSNTTTISDQRKNIHMHLLQAMHGPIRSYVSILPTYWYYLACRSFFEWVKRSSSVRLKYFVHQHASRIISKGPALLHAVIVAAPTDLSIWMIACRLENLDSILNRDQSTSWAFWALFFSLTSWFHGYALIRTYANCFETACLALGIVLLGPELFDKPQGHTAHQHRSKAKVAFVLGGLSACVRFTSLAAWIPLGLTVAIRSGFIRSAFVNSGAENLITKKNDRSAKKESTKRISFSGEYFINFKEMYRTLFGLCAFYGAVGIMLGCSIDRIMYGFWAIPSLGNFHFNVLLGLGSLYGTHPFLWYIYAGIPAICGALLPLIIWDVYALSKILFKDTTITPNSQPVSTNARILLLVVIVPYTMLHSFSEHKEFRFLLPILPLLIVVAGHQMAQLIHTIPTRRKSLTVWISSIACLFLNFPHLVYLGTIHQRGPIALNQFLADEISTKTPRDEPINIHFLMSCHSAPLYSHLHIPGIRIRAWHLDCSPDCRSRHDIVCESDAFLDDPLTFIIDAYGNDNNIGSKVCNNKENDQCIDKQCEEHRSKEIPNFIVVMQDDAVKIEKILFHVLGMHHVASIRHTIKSLSWHRKKYTICENPSSETAFCHDAVTVLSLFDIDFEHIEVYQQSNCAMIN